MKQEDGSRESSQYIWAETHRSKRIYHSGSTPGLALVVQYGFVYAGGRFEQLYDYVAYDLLTPSRLRELFDEDWDDC